MLLMCCTQYASKFGKLSSGHRTVFIPIPKNSNAKECSNCSKIALISHTSKVILKILQARLQQYMNHELPDVQAEFRKGRGTEIKLPTCMDHRKSKRVPEKHLLLFNWLGQSIWLCGAQQNWKILIELGIPDHIPCLLRNLYAGKEATTITDK